MVSSIINNDIEKQYSIYNWIKEKTKKNSIKFELIFKMSRDGSNCKDFHNSCDNKGPTLTLIQTTKNKIFGGFTPLNWRCEKDKDREIKCDESLQTFIFSLNTMKKYDLLNKEDYAITCSINHGPNFGNWNFMVEEDMKQGKIFANENCTFIFNKVLELTGGKGEKDIFETKELEVFKVRC